MSVDSISIPVLYLEKYKQNNLLSNCKRSHTEMKLTVPFEYLSAAGRLKNNAYETDYLDRTGRIVK